jgi:hypothetical protein
MTAASLLRWLVGSDAQGYGSPASELSLAHLADLVDLVMWQDLR